MDGTVVEGMGEMTAVGGGGGGGWGGGVGLDKWEWKLRGG